MYAYVYISLVCLLNFYQILDTVFLYRVSVLFSALGIHRNTAPYSHQALIVASL